MSWSEDWDNYFFLILYVGNVVIIEYPPTERRIINEC
nr:MAG TPA: hypothetical protein [Caudoviricetes sp.]